MNEFNVSELTEEISGGFYRSLARALTLIENELPGSVELLKGLAPSETPVIGITGPPGAGKSTLVNALINLWTSRGRRIAVLAVDPSSPFNMGSLLGDRVRMTGQFDKNNVYIRSVATRGSLGGLSEKTIEMSDLLRSVGFDMVLIETVGVGQSEIEVAGLADVTVLVLVPESGDDVQSIKSGTMEIADIFVVNKADRPGAEKFVNGLKNIVGRNSVPVLATAASTAEGIDELADAINAEAGALGERKKILLTEKALKLISRYRMRDLDTDLLKEQLDEAMAQRGFNLYRFLDERGYT